VIAFAFQYTGLKRSFHDNLPTSHYEPTQKASRGLQKAANFSEFVVQFQSNSAFYDNWLNLGSGKHIQRLTVSE
jgi:hypothetical protein